MYVMNECKNMLQWLLLLIIPAMSNPNNGFLSQKLALSSGPHTEWDIEDRTLDGLSST